MLDNIPNNVVLAALCLVISFAATFILTKYWIKVSRNVGFVGKDMNKYKKPKVAEPGITVIFGFAFSVLVYIFLKTFLFQTQTHMTFIFAMLASVLLAGFLGFIDDILEWRIGLTAWQKVLLTLPIAFPLMVVNAGHSIFNFPFIGQIEFGLLYPLLIVPVAIIGAANGFNLLAGYNGLEAGLGSLILGTLGFVAFMQGEIWLALIAFSAVAALIAFLFFNWYPAKIFPGDSMTYSIGALIAIIAILGNMEKLALFLFIPFFLDAVLLIRARNIEIDAFSKVNPDNSLEPPYKKSYDTTHIALRVLNWLKGKTYEKDVVKLILAAQFIICMIGLRFIIFV